MFMGDSSRESEGEDQHQPPTSALVANWCITVPVAAEQKFFQRYPSTSSWSMPTDILLRVLEFVEVDMPTLQAIPAVCREWCFYSDFMPPWAAMVREWYTPHHKVGVGEGIVLQQVQQVWREQRKEGGDGEHVAPRLGRRLALTIKRTSTFHGEHHYRFENDPGLVRGMFYSGPECIEATFCCLCHYAQGDKLHPHPSCCEFTVTGLGIGIVLLFTGCLFHLLSASMDTKTRFAAIPSYYGDDESGPRYWEAFCSTLLCPPCAICQNRRLFGAYSSICDVERQKPLEELIVELEEMI